MSVPDYSFVRRPKWIAGHTIAAVAIIVFVIAGLWQLARLDERRDRNATIMARAAGNPIELPAAPQSPAEIDALEWQLVQFDARWSVGEEVILQAQTLDGLSGHDVVTPARVGDMTIVVNRGWVPIDTEGPPVAIATPVATSTTVRGVLRVTQERGSFGPVDPPSGVLERVARIDLARLERQLSGELYPMWIQLLEQDPAQPGYPHLRTLPPLDEGPHLSYAVQWFVFAVVVVVGYPTLILRTARTQATTSQRRRPTVT